MSSYSVNFATYTTWAFFVLLGNGFSNFDMTAKSHRVADQIYYNITSCKSQCFRLLNGTHQVGCQSERGGSTGVVFIVKSQSDIETIKNDIYGYGDYVAAVDIEIFSSLARDLHQTTNIVGVFLLKNESQSVDGPFSDDAACPNERMSKYYPMNNRTCVWNPTSVSQGFRFLDWKKPIFLVENDTDVDIIKECYRRYNEPEEREKGREKALCAARLKLFMAAARDAPTCLRRQDLFGALSSVNYHLCDWLADFNLFAFSPPSNKSARSFSPNSVFVLAARMDSLTMMSGPSPGTESVFPALIALLAVVQTVGKHLSHFEQAADSAAKSLLFAVFHGESMDYIGSSGTIFEMKAGRFPRQSNTSLKWRADILRMDHLGAFLEFGQIGQHNHSSPFFAHVDGMVYHDVITANQTKQLFASIKSGMKRKGVNIDIADDSVDSMLPPASYQQFLKEKQNLPGLIISNFKDTFINKHYNSFTDYGHLDRNRTVKAIEEAASGALNAIINWIALELKSDRYKIDPEYISTLYDCFVTADTWRDCEVFRRIWGNDTHSGRVDHGDKITYIGTVVGNRYLNPSNVRKLVKQLMIASLGKELPNNKVKEECTSGGYDDSVYTYTWKRALFKEDDTYRCYKSSVIEKVAVSPAKHLTDYDMRSGQYSTWVESVWSSHSAQLFLVAPAAYKYWLFLSGLVVLFSSFLFSLLLHKYSPLLVNAHPGADTNDPTL